MKLLFVLATVVAAPVWVTEFKETFDGTTELPASWITGITGSGNANWEVVADSSAPSKPNVLRQSGEATFVWAVKSDHAIQNGFVEVKIKPVSGREDQAGGIVWRFKDSENHYILRANALEDNVVLYKTFGGKRSSLQLKGRIFGYGVDTTVPSNMWSSLRVEFVDQLFTVFFNGSKLFEVEDKTFADAGSVGVWTKADSMTLFDDFFYGEK